MNISKTTLSVLKALVISDLQTCFLNAERKKIYYSKEMIIYILAPGVG